MNFTITVPFGNVLFTGALERHKKYFKNLFFAAPKANTKTVYDIVVVFKKINLPDKELLFLEEDIIATGGRLYVCDTQGNKLELDFNKFEDDKLILAAEPEFDLYFLYNYIIEPLLIIWAAKHGILYVHASAFSRKEGAYVFPAWRHSGKTSSIFSLAQEKMEFMGDDFCIYANSRVYLYPKYINIFSYNFQNYPWLYQKLPYSLAFRIKFSVQLKKLLYYLSQKISGPLSKVFFRLSELAEISTNTKITPHQLGLRVRSQAPIYKTVFITKGNRQRKRIKKLNKEQIKQKLLSITIYEINDFLNIYQKFRYLYPENSHPNIDSFAKNYLGAVEKNIDKAYEIIIRPSANKDAFIGRLPFSK